MKIIAVQFDYDGSKKYDKLARVFEHSAKKNCPQAAVEMLRIKAPAHGAEGLKGVKRCFTSNTVKLRLWLDKIKETTEDVIFMDCDMLVLHDLGIAFSEPFDIGLTKRNNPAIPYNGGVVFVRNTPAAIKFLERWTIINDAMFNCTDQNGVPDRGVFHTRWRNKYAGMNQAALGYILEKETHEAKLKNFPCAIWNICREDWPRIDNKSMVIHVKSNLRTAVIDRRCISSAKRAYGKAIELWDYYAQEAGVLGGQITVPIVEERKNMIEKMRGRRLWHGRRTK
jgi:hypothetical protein